MKNSSIGLLICVIALCLFNPLHAQTKPDAALSPVSALGDVSEVEEMMIYNELQAQLSRSYTLVPKSDFAKAQEKVFQELEMEECTESNCIRRIQDILQVDRLFTLMILKAGETTQLSLTLAKGGSKLVETGSCDNCKVSELTQRIRDTTAKVVDRDVGASASSGGVARRQTAGSAPTSGGGEIEIITPTVTAQQGGEIAALSFDTNPSGASVFLGDAQAGTTPFYDDTLLPDQQLVITLKKEEYHDKRLQLNLKGGINDLGTVELAPNFGSLNVNSQPEGAEVLIAGEKLGVTPLQLEQFTSGTYILDLKLPLYLPVKENIQVNDQQETRLSYTLKPDFGTIKVSTVPESAEIRIVDSEGKEVASQGTPAEIKLPPGSYQFSLEKAGYRALSVKISIARGQTQTITPQQATLIKQAGTLLISSDPF